MFNLSLRWQNAQGRKVVHSLWVGEPTSPYADSYPWNPGYTGQLRRL